MSRLFISPETQRSLTAAERAFQSKELVTDAGELTVVGRQLETMLLSRQPGVVSITKTVLESNNYLEKSEFVQIVADAIAKVRHKSPALANNLTDKLVVMLGMLRLNIPPVDAVKWNDQVYVFLVGRDLISEHAAVNHAIHKHTYRGVAIEWARDEGLMPREGAIMARCAFARAKMVGVSADRARVPAVMPGMGSI